MKSVFLSGSWFSKPEQELLDLMKSGLDANPTVGDRYWCLDNQWGEKAVDGHPELASDMEWKKCTYDTDISGIKAQDVVVAMTVPEHGDTGMAQECGFASAIGKPIVLVLPDWAYSENSDASINLMIGMVADVVIPISELPTYDFDHIRHRPYKGKVF